MKVAPQQLSQNWLTDRCVIPAVRNPAPYIQCLYTQEA
jgi:hypothetical protein